jgi:hypothetical protein
MKRIIVAFLMISCGYLSGQEVVVLKVDEGHAMFEEVDGFHCIYAYSDTLYGEPLGRLRGVCANTKKSKLDKLFNLLKDQANALHCNAFSVDSSAFLGQDSIEVYLSTYHLTEEALEKNYATYPRNMVYVFGEINKQKHNGKKFKLNEKKSKLFPLEFVALENQIGEEISVSVGGFLGSKIWVKGKEGRLPTYLSFTGFNAFTDTNTWNNRRGVSFSTGKINYVGIEFGSFLASILRQRSQDEVLEKKKK